MITLSALARRKAASSGEPERTVFCPASVAAAPSAAPKPPRITEMNERFIARHMMQDRIAPEEPTSEPAMMSMALLSEKPMPAAAQPEQLFSTEIPTDTPPP